MPALHVFVLVWINDWLKSGKSIEMDDRFSTWGIGVIRDKFVFESVLIGIES